MNSQKTHSQQQIFEEEAPSFNQTMSLKEVEALFEHQIIKQTQRDRAELMIQTELVKPSVDPNGKNNFNISIEAASDEEGPGKGFVGDELLSRDELNIILDLEDEHQRMGDFKRIFPVSGSCHKYYGLAEVRRYQNALYCAWLATPPKQR